MTARTLRSLFFVTLISSATLLALNPTNAQDKWDWPEKAENLKVLPKDFSKEDLRAVMKGFSRSLGVRCWYCHVGKEGEPLSTYDFASDDNPDKDVARLMMRMLGSINDSLDYIREEDKSKQVNMWCHTCHRGRPLPMTLQEELGRNYRETGLDSTITLYKRLREEFYGRGAYDFGEGSLTQLADELFVSGDADAAIAFLRLNTEQFPESSPVFQYLAMGYEQAGQKELAIQYYEKALELDPDNRRARSKLEKLRGE